MMFTHDVFTHCGKVLSPPLKLMQRNTTQGAECPLAGVPPPRSAGGPAADRTKGIRTSLNLTDSARRCSAVSGRLHSSNTPSIRTCCDGEMTGVRAAIRGVPRGGEVGSYHASLPMSPSRFRGARRAGEVGVCHLTRPNAARHWTRL